MTTFSSYLNKMMRQGASSHNARIVITNTGGIEPPAISLVTYESDEPTSTSPILIRFPDGTAVAITGQLGTVLSQRFNVAIGTSETLYVGIQSIGGSNAQLVYAYERPDTVLITTVPTNTTAGQVAASIVATGPVTWIARITGLQNLDPFWDAAAATIHHIRG